MLNIGRDVVIPKSAEAEILCMARFEQLLQQHGVSCACLR